MGFPLIFTNGCRSFSETPALAIKLGGGLSRSFHLSSGMWQGCPLSPALFIIAMELLSEALCTSPNVKGLRVGWLEEWVALYADDVLLFLNDTGPSLEGALQVLNSFSIVTGLRVNWMKSLLFPLGPVTRATASTDTPLQWVENFKYLGVVVSRQASDYISLNLALRRCDNGWESRPLSFLGCINLLKMNI